MAIRKQRERSFRKSKLMEQFQQISTETQAQHEFYKDRYQFKVLLLEDDLSLGRELAKRLENIRNCRVFVCQSEFSALKLLKQEKIDLVVSDVELQNFNGFDFGESIRMLMKEEIPLIYFSKDNEKQIDYYMNEQSKSSFVFNAFEGNEFQEKFLEMLDDIASLSHEVEMETA